jgi:hypothetical protein
MEPTEFREGSEDWLIAKVGQSGNFSETLTIDGTDFH